MTLNVYEKNERHKWNTNELWGINGNTCFFSFLKNFHLPVYRCFKMTFILVSF